MMKPTYEQLEQMIEKLNDNSQTKQLECDALLADNNELIDDNAILEKELWLTGQYTPYNVTPMRLH